MKGTRLFLAWQELVEETGQYSKKYIASHVMTNIK